MPLLPRWLVAATILVTIVAGCGSIPKSSHDSASSMPKTPDATTASPSAAAAESSSPIQPTTRPPNAPAPAPAHVASAVWSKPRLVAKGDCWELVATIDPDGRHHIAAVCSEKIVYLVSNDGASWSKTTLDTPAHRLERDPQLAVDGDSIYLAYSRLAPTEGGCGDDGLRDVGVYVRSRHLPDGDWSEPARVGSAGDSLQTFRVRDGVEHLVVSANDGTKVFYEAAAGASTTRIQLPNAISAAVRVGDDGHARIAYNTSHSIRYARVDGARLSTEAVATIKESYIWWPSLVLGAGDTPYVTWTQMSDGGGGCAGPGPNPIDGTYFGTASGDHWTTTRISKSTNGSVFTVDADSGRIHALVGGIGGLRYFTSATGERWTSRTLPGTKSIFPAVVRVDPTSGELVVFASGDKGIYVLTKG